MMFIPNKTYHAMRVGILAVIATLLLVIAGGTVLYVTSLNNQNEKIAKLSARLDSLSVTSNKIDKNSVNRDSQVQNQITDAVTTIASLENSLQSAKQNIQILISNECQVRPYYMDKRLSDMCSQ